MTQATSDIQTAVTVRFHCVDIHHAIFPETQQWLQPCLKGPKMSARGQHVAVVAGQTLVVFGGTSQFSQETMQCQQFLTDVFLVSLGENYTHRGAFICR